MIVVQAIRWVSGMAATGITVFDLTESEEKGLSFTAIAAAAVVATTAT